MVTMLWIVSLVAAFRGNTGLAVATAILGFLVLVIRAIMSGDN